MVEAVYLVSCVKLKRGVRSAAKDPYISAWFQKARRYVEATGDPWFILSAKYGFFAPDDVIDPYEQTLKRMMADDRRTWAKDVQADLIKLPNTRRIVVLAGAAYRTLLVDCLRRLAPVEVPMECLGLGLQLQWLEGSVPK